MPMPPPKASTEGRRDRQVFHEMGQIVRALEQQGPQTPGRAPSGSSARRYWEHHRFDRALAFAVADGLVDPDRRRPAPGDLTAGGRRRAAAQRHAPRGVGPGGPRVIDRR